MKKTFKLTTYEKAIEAKANQVKPYPKSHKIYRRLRVAAINTTKSQAISLRVNHQTLKLIKSRARAVGLPYQTLINSVLYRYAKGDYKPML
ncbi:hypothetical protein A2W24_06880 [Microgenomates group bacterium RBG_16_45_19]|nr:MAG: hypothetical protein A2W24_06880 [Microgenomates group bacterium RBG_16_45_19]